MEATFVSSSTDSKYATHTGHTVKIIADLDEFEYDREEVGVMFKVETENGEQFDVFTDELSNFTNPVYGKAMEGFLELDYNGLNYSGIHTMSVFLTERPELGFGDVDIWLEDFYVWAKEKEKK